MGKRFEITVEGSVILDEDEIWPDGDAPDHPTEDDVDEVISSGHLYRVMVDWNLDNAFEFVVRDAQREVKS